MKHTSRYSGWVEKPPPWSGAARIAVLKQAERNQHINITQS